MKTKIFVDTLFIIALINKRDQYHQKALQFAQQYQNYPLITTKDNDKLIVEIKQYWDLSSKRFGKLIQRFDGVWHYGVALSDDYGISWGPNKQGELYYKGSLSIHTIEKEFKDAVLNAYLNYDEILANLIASVHAFHNKWHYGVQGWNCEHWARLVVTGNPICYQTKEMLFGIFDLGALNYRSEAIEELNKFKVFK